MTHAGQGGACSLPACLFLHPYPYLSTHPAFPTMCFNLRTTWLCRAAHSLGLPCRHSPPLYSLAQPEHWSARLSLPCPALNPSCARRPSPRLLCPSPTLPPTPPALGAPFRKLPHLASSRLLPCALPPPSRHARPARAPHLLQQQAVKQLTLPLC